MEKVRFGTTEYELPANGVQLGDQGGKVIFVPGASTFADIEADVKAAKSITVLDTAGSPILTRTDMVYAGRLTKDDNYIVGSENTADGAQDVVGTVMVAEFRQPDVREELAAVKAQLDYVTMMADIPMEEV